MTKNYKPRPGFSLTKLKSWAESFKESQQKVKQNIIKVIAVTISTHILKKLSRLGKKKKEISQKEVPESAWSEYMDASCVLNLKGLEVSNRLFWTIEVLMTW